MIKAMVKNKSINIKGTEIAIIAHKKDDYISLTDMAKSQMQEVVIIKWLSLKGTIEYLGEWEALYNPEFNYTEFGIIKNEAGSNNFVLSVKNWIKNTNAIGLTARAGRYGGTYGHKDIAFHFGMWISPKFQLLLVKEYQRLKEDESNRLNLEWNFQRTLSKVNYKIHTDAIKERLIPKELNKKQVSIIYANEAEYSTWHYSEKRQSNGAIKTQKKKVTLEILQTFNNWLFYQIWKALTRCLFTKAFHKTTG